MLPGILLKKNQEIHVPAGSHGNILSTTFFSTKASVSQPCTLPPSAPGRRQAEPKAGFAKLPPASPSSSSSSMSKSVSNRRCSRASTVRYPGGRRNRSSAARRVQRVRDPGLTHYSDLGEGYAHTSGGRPLRSSSPKGLSVSAKPGRFDSGLAVLTFGSDLKHQDGRVLRHHIVAAWAVHGVHQVLLQLLSDEENSTDVLITSCGSCVS